VPIQLALFLSIRNANIETARANIDEALQVTAQIFTNTLGVMRDSLLDKARGMSSEYSFKQVANTNEHQTVLSALTSYEARIGADIMLVLTMDGEIVADTRHPELTRAPFYVPALIDIAMNSEYGEADLIEFVDDLPYVLVAVPLFSPEPSHWIISGFLITDEFAWLLQETTKSQVSILFGAEQQKWRQLATTLPPEKREASERAMQNQPWQFGSNFDLVIDGKSFVSVALPVRETSGQYFIGLLQRSLDEALAPYQRLHILVASVFFIAIVLLIIGGVYVARKITKPVTLLAQGAKEIEEGHYELNIKVDQEDEMGQLADRFGSMAKGLADRDKIRGVLGKVVSPAIAEQLLSKGVELGGEERHASILFSDIRNFTSMCETQSAKEVITVLNKLLTRFSVIIDRHNGVVDKYIGDAVMALFGVPVENDNQAHDAVMAALDMIDELATINPILADMKLPQIGLGVGVNTDTVVAGNMGSETRLNYTVIGDGVNLSARLEGLTKFYGAAVLTSESTRSLCPEICFREVDSVRVKGKQDAITIYEPLGLISQIPEAEAAQLGQFNTALGHYQQQQWQQALEVFKQLAVQFPDVLLFQIYLKRVTELQGQPIDPGWDGVFTHKNK
jgi:adenylate cyclase